MTDIMKVRVTINVEVDVDAITRAYGIERKDIRQDVRDSVLNAITSGGIYNAAEGVVWNATHVEPGR